MLRVKTEIAPSEIDGIGLFAAEFIPRGSIVWEFTRGFDRQFTKGAILQLPSAAHIYLAKYAYKSRKSGRYILAEDNGKYFNHSSTPNTMSVHADGVPEVVTYALRDIHIGEEITDDYSSFEDENDSNNLLSEFSERYRLVVGHDGRRRA